MRWIVSKEPEIGNLRVISKWLLFPKVIDNEWRWLEKAKIRQVFGLGWIGDGCIDMWIDLEWVG